MEKTDQSKKYDQNGIQKYLPGVTNLFFFFSFLETLNAQHTANKGKK